MKPQSLLSSISHCRSWFLAASFWDFLRKTASCQKVLSSFGGIRDSKSRAIAASSSTKTEAVVHHLSYWCLQRTLKSMPVVVQTIRFTGPMLPFRYLRRISVPGESLFSIMRYFSLAVAQRASALDGAWRKTDEAFDGPEVKEVRPDIVPVGESAVSTSNRLWVILIIGR